MDAQWLNKQFELYPDKTKAGLAEALGLEPPAVSKILKGMRQIKAKEYAIMRGYFGLPVDGTQAVNRHLARGHSLKPLRGNLMLKEDISTDEEEWIIPETVLSKHTEAPPEKIKIFKISDSLMEPYFRLGEYVLVDLSDTKPSPPGSFVVSDGYSHFVRQCEILPVSSPTEVQISARDKAFVPQKLKLDEVKIIGRIIAKLQWM